jgi:hypothetical protein
LEVLDARLTLSHIFNAIETSNYLFSAHRGITNKISKMKVYLDELIDEYESEIETLRVLPEAEQIPRLRELKVFGDFIRKTDSSNYVTRFLAKAYRPAVSEIRKEVIRARQVDVNEVNQNASLDETS